MADWTEPIYDRTQEDVDYAKKRIAYFKANGGVSDGVNLKGCLNYTDVNRIEDNTDYLADLLISLYYFNTISRNSSSWVIKSILDTTNVSRIINNVAILQSAYYTPIGSPDLPTTLTHYEQVNSVEKCLYLLKEMIDDMVSSFRECGTFYCGEE